MVVGGVTEAWLLRCSAREAAADADWGDETAEWDIRVRLRARGGGGDVEGGGSRASEKQPSSELDSCTG